MNADAPASLKRIHDLRFTIYEPSERAWPSGVRSNTKAGEAPHPSFNKV